MERAKQTKRVSAKEVHVLVVGQSSEACGAMAPRLKEQGYRVRTVCDPRKGLEAARRFALDMVVLCGEQRTAVEDRIVTAAHAKNSEVGVVRIELDDLGRPKFGLESVLDALQARRRLRRLSNQFDALLEGLLNGVIVVDVGTGRITLANEAAGKLVDYRREELRQMSIKELVPEDSRDETETMLERLPRERSIRGGALVLRRKDGELLHCQFNAIAVGTSSERRVQIVFEDVSDKRKLLQHLAELGEAFSLAEAISGIVHEMNNPLAAVLGYAQLSLTTTSRKKLDEYLQTIYQQAGRCQATAQKLSSFARRREPEKKVTDLNGIIEEAASFFVHELTRSNIRVRLDISPCPLPVRVDRGQIQQVFVNLIKNAKEAMAGVIRGRLSITSQRLGREAVIVVSDAGPGIPEEHHQRIFQPFFSTKPQATGLGLSIARSILAANDAEINMVAGEGQGATFRLRFPLAEEADVLDRETPPSAGEGDFPRGKAILVIEDERPIANLVRQILTRAGEKVDVALTPAQAYKRIEGKDYDMILIDIKMPGGDGKEIFRRLSEINSQAAQKVVFCTGDLLDEETRRFLSGLDNRVIEKPFSISRIYAVARRVL